MSMRRTMWTGLASLATLAGLTAVALFAMPLARTHAAASVQPGTRTIFVTAFGDKGAPEKDMTAAEFLIKEDGKAREVVSAAISRTPMQILMMLDDSGLALGAIRQGAGQFVEALQGQAEFAITTIGANNVPLIDYSRDPPALFDALRGMLARNNPPVYVLDALLEGTRAFIKRGARRPVIVLVATEGDEFSNTSSDDVMDSLQTSGARLYYIGLGAPVTKGYSPPLGAARPADATQSESSKRNAVLGAAPKNSAGRSEQVLQSSGVPVIMKQFATELANVYEITYKSDAASAKLGVETKRKGVKLRAPVRVGAR
jgi:hypothetical protein